KEEELTRENLTKVADQIKGIRERQEALTTESARIHDEVLQKKEWTRALRASLLRVGDAQNELGQETEQIAQEQLKQASVFEHLLTKSANAMQQAADKMQDLPQQDESADFSSKQTPLNPVALDTASQEVQGFQRAASRRLD